MSSAVPGRFWKLWLAMELAVTDALDGFMSWDDGGMSTDEGLTF